MARFTYTVKDTKGHAENGIVEAVSIKHAGALLHERGYFIIEIKPAEEAHFLVKMSSGKISQSDLVHFTRQLSTMLTAGLTIVESLSILQQQIKKPSFVSMVSTLQEEMQGGSTFAAVLDKYTDIFPAQYRGLVRAGEASGKLDVILTRLADNLEKSQTFRKKISGALLYPAVIVSSMVIVTIIVMTVVVPRLTGLYKEFGISLPVPTQILIAVSEGFVKYSWLAIILISIAMAAFTRFRKTPTGQRILAQVQLSIPVVGHLIREATIVETTRTLSILIDGGVPILTALEIAKDTTGNILFKEGFANAAKKVEDGFPLSTPLMENALFPPILGQMVAVGEQTGKLGDSLYKLSGYFEAEADNAVRSLTTLIEPLIMVVLGIGVGFLVMAVLLPIYSLTSNF